jgi:CrcB protein
MVSNMLLVALGGAFGASFRYFIGEMIVRFGSKAQIFPVSTFTVNVLGSFVAGVMYFIFSNYVKDVDDGFRLVLVVGFLGGFTTFSAFSLDVLKLLNSGEMFTSFIYIILSVLLSILAIFLGYYISSLA